MKNLKKVLAMVLVVAMVASFAVTASATSFTDDASINYSTAVEVLSGLGVINGKSDGAFHPTDDVTRGQFAKMAAYVLNGGSDAAASYASSATTAFADVASTHYAAASIGYVVNKGLVDGFADGTYRPDSSVTGVQAAKILLTALGYKSDIEGYTGTTWAQNVQVDAEEAGLFTGIENIDLTANLSREEAAQMIWNALQATTVSYAVGGTTITTSDGTTISTGASAATPVTTGAVATYTNGSATQLELVEKCFGGLTVTPSIDSFGRPTTVYTRVNGTAVATTVATPVATFTAATTAAKVKAAIGATLNDTVTGTPQSPSTLGADVVAATANGTTVEVYADGTIVTIVPTYATVTVSTAKENRTHGAYTQYAVTINAQQVTGRVFSSVVDEAADVDTAIVTGTIENGDKVLAYTDGTVLYISAVKTATGAVTAKASTGSVTIGGTAYTLASGVAGAAAIGAYSVDANTNGTAYLDANGFLLEFVADGGNNTTNYALVVASSNVLKQNGKNLVQVPETTIVTTDGELLEVTSSQVINTLGAVYTYTVTNDVYTFTTIDGTPIDGTAGTTRVISTATQITNKDVTMANDNTKMNSKTVFYFVNYDANNNATSVTTYTGINAVPSIAAVNAGLIVSVDSTTAADGIADVVFVNTNTTDPATSSDYVFYLGTYVQDSTGYVLDVIKGGEKTTLTVSSIANVNANTLYATVSSTGAVTTPAAGATFAKIQNVGGLVYTSANAANATTYNATYQTIADDVVVYMIDPTDGSATVTDGKALETETTGTIYVAATAANVITAVYVILP
jgi:hypothetical protein